MYDDTTYSTTQGGDQAPKAKRRSIPLPLKPADTRRVLETALSLAEKGVPIFALGSDRKPIDPLGWHSATTKEEDIREMFGAGRALIGLRPSAAGLVVIDIPRERVSDPLVISLRRVLNPLCCTTMNGGQQFYFKAPDGLAIGSGYFRRLRVIHDQGYVLPWGNPGYERLSKQAEVPPKLPDWVIEEITSPWQRGDIWKPSDAASLPKPDFWDDDQLLIRIPGGAIELLGAKEGAHKTNLVLSMCFAAIQQHPDIRIVYAAGEGGYGVVTQRLPAHCAEHGISPETIDRNLVVFDYVPLLSDPNSVTMFLTDIEDRMPEPDWIVIDTLATAMAGMDENGSIFSSVLTGNGAVGRIKSHQRCLILIPAHFGKKEEAGLRGHSGLQGNADGVLLLSSHENGGLDLFAHKIKYGGDKFHTYYQVPPAGTRDIVPIPRRISKDEYDELLKRSAAGKSGKEPNPHKANTLAALKDLPPTGATHTDWQDQAMKVYGVSKAAFNRWRKWLVARGWVEEVPDPVEVAAGKKKPKKLYFLKSRTVGSLSDDDDPLADHCDATAAAA